MRRAYHMRERSYHMIGLSGEKASLQYHMVEIYHMIGRSNSWRLQKCRIRNSTILIVEHKTKLPWDLTRGAPPLDLATGHTRVRQERAAQQRSRAEIRGAHPRRQKTRCRRSTWRGACTRASQRARDELSDDVRMVTGRGRIETNDSPGRSPALCCRTTETTALEF